MNVSQWEKARDIFDAAVDLPEGKRSAYVEEACHGDTVLRVEVEELLAADAQAEGFLDAAWIVEGLFPADVALHAGDVVSGRFRILRALGDGGMGQVYEAHDAELGVQVALKTLRPEVAGNAEVLHRFRQEVRIAHRITHPNVCRTFHLDRERRQVGPGERDVVDLTFLTMEYLNGETLQQIMKRTGRLSTERALGIARQVAEALQAAHQAGIIHRDIKPGNVMICAAVDGSGAERAVVTDFGLAKYGASSGQSDRTSLSEPGRAMGTLAYMAPEQLEAGEATPATDVYAFGLLLFEMVTGQKAFPDSGTLPSAFRRLREAPPSAAALVPELPAAWEAAILGCLQVAPEARFQRTGDVMAVLDGAAASGLRIVQPSAPKGFAMTRGRVLAAMAIVIGVVSLFFGLQRLFQSRADAAVAPGTLVYLAPVKNETGEKQLENVTELVQAGLNQSARINLLDQGRVGDLLQRMTKPAGTPITPAIAREIAMRANAARVVFTTIARDGSGYHLDVDLQEPDNVPTRYREHWSKTFRWQGDSGGGTIPGELLTTVRVATNWIRNNVGESRNDIARLDAPPEDVTTDNWEALADYSQAQQLMSQGQTLNAIDLLQQAVQLDPHFALAYGGLGDLFATLGRMPEAYAAYRHALMPDLERHLTRRERDRIKGMYAVDTGDVQMAENAFRDYTMLYESDPLGWAYRSYPLELLGKVDDAIAVLHHASALAPHRSFAVSELVACYLRLGRYDEARQAIGQLRQDHFDGLAALYEGQLQFLLGQYDQAESTLQTLATAEQKPYRRMAFGMLARVRAERGDDAGAMAALHDAVAFAESNHLPEEQAGLLLDRALVWADRGMVSSALDDVSRALALDPNVRNIANASSVLGVANRTTHFAQSKVILERLAHLRSLLPAQDDYADLELARLHVEGETLLAHGDWQGALDRFERAASLEPPSGSRDYLARAYVFAADRQSSSSEAESFRRKAMEAYEGIALHPGVVWSHSATFPPALLRREVEGWLQVAAAVHAPDAMVRPVREFYAGLRVPSSL